MNGKSRLGEAEINRLSEKIIGAAIEVHRALGPGLLESVYEEALCHELGLRGLAFARQVQAPLQYKGVNLTTSLRLDLIVEETLVIELKSVEELLPIHDAQVLTCLRLSGNWLGLLINFNVPVLRDGIKRLVNGPRPIS